VLEHAAKGLAEGSTFAVVLTHGGPLGQSGRADALGRHFLDSKETFDQPELTAFGGTRDLREAKCSAQGRGQVAAYRVAEHVQAFKVGVNRPRSRGDREEVFGGLGASWKGAFVGGDLLVQAVTYGPDGAAEKLYGNFPDYSLLPER